MDGDLRGDASLNADAGDPIRRDGRARSPAQASLPLDHLTAMFGLSIILAASLLVGSFACFFDSDEVETQVPRLAAYRVSINSDRWVEFAKSAVGWQENGKIDCRIWASDWRVSIGGAIVRGQGCWRKNSRGY